MNLPKIILASQSPRRQQLLGTIGVNFEVIAANCDEIFPDDLALDKVPTFLAKEKATIVSQQMPDALIIAADTVVIIDKKIIGKPIDRKDAVDILKKLSGRKHEVITGIAVTYKGQTFTTSAITEVFFNNLSEHNINHYVDQYKPYDKAGAYAIQEYIGVVGIKEIRGSFYNVMGLPVDRLLDLIQEKFGLVL